MIRENKGAILILSGPSGCGKSSLLKKLYQNIDNYYFSISTTTRQPREGEKHGVDYFFVDKSEFEAGIKNDDFLEYAEVHGNYYGTSKKAIKTYLDKNYLVIFDIDTQGQSQIVEQLPKTTTSVFITTPTLSILKSRLIQRQTDDTDTINKRLKNAQTEITKIDNYDFIIVNDDLSVASAELLYIAKSAKLKTKLFDTSDICDKWISN